LDRFKLFGRSRNRSSDMYNGFMGYDRTLCILHMGRVATVERGNMDNYCFRRVNCSVNHNRRVEKGGT